jgi:hypothetical protein
MRIYSLTLQTQQMNDNFTDTNNSIFDIIRKKKHTPQKNIEADYPNLPPNPPPSPRTPSSHLPESEPLAHSRHLPLPLQATSGTP